MDIRWGYNNVRIREGDTWKATFLCNFGLYEPLVMFFGLTNSPATFQSMMNNIFQLEILQGWLVDYIDAILLLNKGDCEDLSRKAITVLEKLEQHDLFVKSEKSEYFVTNVSFLEFKVEDGKLAMEQQKVSGIANWPPPETVTQVKSFPCFCNFYQRFINHHANMCQLLNDLLKKTEQWKWNDERQAAYEPYVNGDTTSKDLHLPLLFEQITPISHIIDHHNNRQDDRPAGLSN